MAVDNGSVFEGKIAFEIAWRLLIEIANNKVLPRATLVNMLAHVAEEYQAKGDEKTVELLAVLAIRIDKPQDVDKPINKRKRH